jgi:hypothetical protein
VNRLKLTIIIAGLLSLTGCFLVPNATITWTCYSGPCNPGPNYSPGPQGELRVLGLSSFSVFFAGGTNITIFGQGFTPNSSVTINNLPCATFSYISYSELTCSTTYLPIGSYPLNVTDNGVTVSGGTISATTDYFTVMDTPPGLTSFGLGNIDGMVSDNSNNLFLIDKTKSLIYQYNLSTKVITVVAGTANSFSVHDGLGTDAGFKSLNAIAFDSSSNIFYIGDGNLIRVFNPTTTLVSTIYGQDSVFSTFNGTGTTATFNSVNGLAIDSVGQYMYVSDENIIRRITLSTQLVETLAGLIGNFSSTDSTDGGGDTASFTSTKGLVFSSGNLLVLDSNNLRVVKVSSGSTTTLINSPTAGFTDGLVGNATLTNPSNLTLDSVGQKVYISDLGNNAIRKLDLTTNVVSTVLGGPSLSGTNDGPLNMAEIFNPASVFFVYDGSLSGLYVGSTTFLKVIH